MRGDDLGLGIAVDVERRLERDRLEVLALGRRLHRLEAGARSGEQLRGEVALDPAFERRMLGRADSCGRCRTSRWCCEFLTVAQP